MDNNTDGSRLNHDHSMIPFEPAAAREMQEVAVMASDGDSNSEIGDNDGQFSASP